MIQTIKEFLYEDDNFGVKTDIDKEDAEDVINPNIDLKKEDIKILGQIAAKLTSGIKLFTDLYEFAKDYNKINIGPIEDILNKIKTFQSELQKEM